MCQEESGRWVLTGVVAGGYGCADPSSPALYTRVSRFRGWIDEVIDARVQQEAAHAQTQEDVTHNDLMHAHEGQTEGKQAHGKLKETHDQQHNTNEFNKLKQKHTHAHLSHTNQHQNTHTHHVEDANTQTVA